jgi:hypothetical protein
MELGMPFYFAGKLETVAGFSGGGRVDRARNPDLSVKANSKKSEIRSFRIVCGVSVWSCGLWKGAPASIPFF